jgi:hypothetical protein
MPPSPVTALEDFIERSVRGEAAFAKSICRTAASLYE